MLVFIYAYLSLFKTSIQNKQLLLLALIAPIVIHSQTEYPFYHSATHWFYFIVFIWLANDKLGDQQELPLNNTFLVKTSAIIMPVIVIPFMITTLQTSILMEKFKQSRFKDITYFNAIINKLAWRDYIEVTIQTESLKRGYQNKSPDSLKQYIAWGQEFVTYRPRESAYENMLRAIETLNQIGSPVELSVQQQLIADAARLYPENNYFQQTADKYNN